MGCGAKWYTCLSSGFKDEGVSGLNLACVSTFSPPKPERSRSIQVTSMNVMAAHSGGGLKEVAVPLCQYQLL